MREPEAKECIRRIPPSPPSLKKLLALLVALNIKKIIFFFSSFKASLFSNRTLFRIFLIKKALLCHFLAYLKKSDFLEINYILL